MFLFSAAGGKLLVIGEGILDSNKKNLILDIGASYIGPGEFDRDYLVIGNELKEGLVTSPFLFYKPALRVKPNEATQVLASIREPYFSRTYGAFTSHQNTPYKLSDASHPGIIQHNNILFIAHKLDEMYYKHGAYLHRDLFKNCLDKLEYNPMIEVDLPSVGRISLLHQEDRKRFVAHLLYASPITRGECEVIEDLPSLFNTTVSVDLPEDIQRAILIPEMKELEISKSENRLIVTIPEFNCHSAISFEYE